MEVKKFTNKKKSFLKPKFKQSENISIAEEFQNKPFQSNDNEVQTTLIFVECLKFCFFFLWISRLFMLYIQFMRCAFRNTRKTIATFVKQFASSPSNADTNKKWIFATKKKLIGKKRKKNFRSCKVIIYCNLLASLQTQWPCVKT